MRPELIIVCCTQVFTRRWWILVGLHEGVVEGGEAALKVLAVGVQPHSQVLHVGGREILDLLGALGHLRLHSLGHGGQVGLEFLDLLVHLDFEVVGVGSQLSLLFGADVGPFIEVLFKCMQQNNSFFFTILL